MSTEQNQTEQRIIINLRDGPKTAYERGFAEGHQIGIETTLNTLALSAHTLALVATFNELLRTADKIAKMCPELRETFLKETRRKT